MQSKTNKIMKNKIIEILTKYQMYEVDIPDKSERIEEISLIADEIQLLTEPMSAAEYCNCLSINDKDWYKDGKGNYFHKECKKQIKTK